MAEEISLNPDALIDLLRRKEEKERKDDKRCEDLNRIELENMLEELKSLQDQQARSIQNINKNLKTLVNHKHVIAKLVEGSKSESPKLPVTHKHLEDAINFVSNAINFVNDYSKIEESVKPENDVDMVKLCEEINLCGESVNQELKKAKARINQVETLRENTEMIKNHCFLPCDDD